MPADTPTECGDHGARCAGLQESPPTCELRPVEDPAPGQAPEADYTPRARAGTHRQVRGAAQVAGCAAHEPVNRELILCGSRCGVARDT